MHFVASNQLVLHLLKSLLKAYLNILLLLFKHLFMAALLAGARGLLGLPVLLEVVLVSLIEQDMKLVQ